MDILNLIIRELRPEDGGALGRFLESLSPQTEYFFHPYPLKMDSAIEFVKRKDIFCLVAEINGEIVGYAWWEPKSAEIPTIGLCVGEAYQGKGIGKKLLEKLLIEAKQEGKRGLRLTVMKNNSRAIALYKKFGFHIVGEVNDPKGEAWKMLVRINTAKKIFIVPYCHPDWAWTHTRLWHERRYNLVFNEVLDIIEEHPNFRWYMDNYLCQLTPFLKFSPHRLKELKERIKEGKIAICGGFSNIRPNMVGEETYIRNLVIGKRRFLTLFPEADLSVHADAVDVSVGHPQMPQVLTLAGYRYLVFWRPEVALNHKEIPYEFVWEGLDGSRIIAHRACYGGLCFKEMVPDDFKERWEEVVKFWWQRELGYRTLFSPTGLIWLSHGNDDARPLRTLFTDEKIDLISFVEEWNKRETVPMAFATPLEYFKELEKEELPVVKGTLDPCDVCYNSAFGGSFGLWKLRLQTDKELCIAETWEAFASLFGHPTKPDFLTPWENLLNYSAHATQWLFQEDFDNLYMLALQTLQSARERKIQAIKAICQHIIHTGNDEAFVFNPLPYPREEIVTLLFSFPDKIPSSFTLQDVEGKEIPFQVVREVGLPGWEIEVLAKLSLPPLGYTTVKLSPGINSQNYEKGYFPKLIWKDGEIFGIKVGEGEFFQLSDYTDGFGSLKLFKVDVSADLHIGEILEVKKVSWDKIEKIGEGPLRQSFLRQGTVDSHLVEQIVHLYENENRIEFDTTINWRGEDGFIAFCIPLPFDGHLFGNTPFGVEIKELEKEIYGVVEGAGVNVERWRRGTFFAKSFIDWSNGVNGMAYISHDGDRYYIFDSKERTIYHILINSIVTCEGWEKDINFQRKGIGLHRFRSSILFHRGDLKEGKIFEKDMFLRYPPEVVYRDIREQKPPSPPLPRSYSFLSLKPNTVLLTAFYRDDEYFYLRFFETIGEECEVEIRFPFQIKEANPVDFFGNSLDDPKIEINFDTLSLKVKPWKIITLKLKAVTSSL